MTQTVGPHHNSQNATCGIDALVAPFDLAYKRFIYEWEPQEATRGRERDK